MILQYITDGRNLIKIGSLLTGVAGLIVSTVVGLSGGAVPAYQVTDTSNNNLWMVTNQGAMGVGNPASFGTLSQCLKSGGDSGSSLTWGSCGSGGGGGGGGVQTGSITQIPYYNSPTTLSGARLFTYKFATKQVALGTSTYKATLTVSGAIAASTTLSGSALTIQGGQSVIGGNLSVSGALLVKNASTIENNLTVQSALSGAFVHAEKGLSSSGGLVWEGTASGAFLIASSQFSGAGLTSCSNGVTSKLLWNSSTNRFSCGTDQTGGSGGGRISGTGSDTEVAYFNGTQTNLSGSYLFTFGVASKELDLRGTLSGAALVVSNGSTTINKHAYTWPSTQGTNGQALTNNGSDSLSWTTISGGGGGSAGPISGTGAATQLTYFTGKATVSGASLTSWNEAGGRMGINTSSPVSALQVVSKTATQSGVFIKQAASQSADALEILNSSSTVLDSVNAKGELKVASTAGIYYGGTGSGSPLSVELTRAVSGTVGDTVQIGNFDITNGGHAMRMTVTMETTGLSLAKTYIISSNYTGFGTAVLTPISDGGPYLTEDFQVIGIGSNSNLALSIRKSLGTQAGTAKIRIENMGDTTDVFTATSATSTASDPGIFYNGLYVLPVGKAIDASLAGSYSVTSWNGGGNPVPLFVTTPTNNGGSSPSATYPALTLVRNGINGQAYNNMVEFKIGRFDNTSVNARSRLDVALTGGNGDAVGTNVLGVQSNGRVGINDSSALPAAGLEVVSTTATDAGVMIKAAASQTASLEEWQNSSGTPQSVVFASGALGIKETTYRATLNVKGMLSGSTLTVSNAPSEGSSQNALCITAQGIVQENNTTTCLVSSLRFKHDVQTMGDLGLDEINGLRPVYYKDNATDTGEMGLIAEEVQKIDPTLVFYDKDGKTVRGVKYENLTALLVKAVQELDRRTRGVKVSNDPVPQAEIDALSKATPDHSSEWAGGALGAAVLYTEVRRKKSSSSSQS